MSRPGDPTTALDLTRGEVQACMNGLASMDAVMIESQRTYMAPLRNKLNAALKAFDAPVIEGGGE